MHNTLAARKEAAQYSRGKEGGRSVSRDGASRAWPRGTGAGDGPGRLPAT